MSQGKDGAERLAALEAFAAAVAREAGVGLCAMTAENKHISLRQISLAAEEVGYDVLGYPKQISTKRA